VVRESCLDHPASFKGPLCSADQPPYDVHQPPTGYKMFCKQRKISTPRPLPTTQCRYLQSFLASSKILILASFGRAFACWNCGVDASRAASEPVRLYADCVLDNVTRCGCGYGDLRVLQSGGHTSHRSRGTTSPGLKGNGASGESLALRKRRFIEDKKSSRQRRITITLQATTSARRPAQTNHIPYHSAGSRKRSEIGS
jgi:hypothetical protein